VEKNNERKVRESEEKKGEEREGGDLPKIHLNLLDHLQSDEIFLLVIDFKLLFWILGDRYSKFSKNYFI